MSGNKCTPEPWPEYTEIGDFGHAHLTEAEYNRARECVNALAGEKDPFQFVGMGKTYIHEDKRIRELIKADENESTYDEVERLMKQREELAEQVSKLTESLDLAHNYIRFNLSGLP